MYKINIKEEKKKLRTQFKKQRLTMSPSHKKENDEKIHKRILDLWSYKEADTLFIYVSTPIEVDTISLIRHSLQLGKKVAVPYCIEHSYKMDFYYINDFDRDLEARTFGVLEPKPNQCEKVTDYTNGICFVPALAYDTGGYRLGYGKGYYDRFLNLFSGTTIGLIYADCVVPRLPHGRYDKKVDILIAEKYVKPTIIL